MNDEIKRYTSYLKGYEADGTSVELSSFANAVQDIFSPTISHDLYQLLGEVVGSTDTSALIDTIQKLSEPSVLSEEAIQSIQNLMNTKDIESQTDLVGRKVALGKKLLALDEIVKQFPHFSSVVHDAIKNTLMNVAYKGFSSLDRVALLVPQCLSAMAQPLIKELMDIKDLKAREDNLNIMIRKLPPHSEEIEGILTIVVYASMVPVLTKKLNVKELELREQVEKLADLKTKKSPTVSSIPAAGGKGEQ